MNSVTELVQKAGLKVRGMSVEEKAAIIVEILQDTANAGFGQDEKPLAEAINEALRYQHRTLQAGSIRILRGVLTEYGKVEHFDLRNEAAVEFAREVTDRVTRPIPFI